MSLPSIEALRDEKPGAEAQGTSLPSLDALQEPESLDLEPALREAELAARMRPTARTPLDLVARRQPRMDPLTARFPLAEKAALAFGAGLLGVGAEDMEAAFHGAPLPSTEGEDLARGGGEFGGMLLQGLLAAGPGARAGKAVIGGMAGPILGRGTAVTAAGSLGTALTEGPEAAVERAGEILPYVVAGELGGPLGRALAGGHGAGEILGRSAGALVPAALRGEMPSAGELAFAALPLAGTLGRAAGEGLRGARAPLPTLEALRAAEPPGKALQAFDREIAAEKAPEARAEAERGALRFGGRRGPQPTFKFTDPEVEARFEGARGVKPERWQDRAREAIRMFGRSLTSEWMTLPRGAKWEPARFALKKLDKQPAVTAVKTYETLKAIGKDLDPVDSDLFRRKVILDDVTEDARLFQENAKPGADPYVYPFGFDATTLAAESARLDAALTPKALGALATRTKMWEALRADYVEAMGAIGYPVEGKLGRSAYFRHQVLDYMEAKHAGASPEQRLRTPSGRSYLKRRTGKGLDFNTEYAEAEFEVVSRMRHDIEIARTIKEIEREYDIAKQLKKQAKGEDADWRDLLPEGYRLWQPREGHAFFMASTIPERIALDALENKMPGLAAEDVRRVLARGGRFREMAIPEEVAATLDQMGLGPSDQPFLKTLRQSQRGWKVWVLFAPRRFIRYTSRNLTGDAEPAFAGNPSAFRRAPDSVRELYRVMARGEAMTPDMEAWFDRGGALSTLAENELGGLKKLSGLAPLFAPQQRGAIIRSPFKWYWRKTRMVDTFREGILRYAAFKDYLEQMRANPQGQPKNFGASVPEEVMALRNVEDRAFKLSNELLGAYDSISVTGQALRSYLVPFWSWKEVNFRRYTQLIKNAARSGEAAKVGMRLAAVKSPVVALRIGTFALKATAFWTMLQAYNSTRYPQEERELPEEIRGRPHLVLGRDKDGKVLYFSRMGALGDFLEWFGLDTPVNYVRDYLDGRRTVKEIAVEMAKSPMNVLASGVSPLIKVPAEVTTRRSIYPDVTRPGTVRDRWMHVARSVGLEEEYRAIAGLPSRGYKETWRNLLLYRVDPKEAAYFDTLDEKGRFLRAQGRGAEGSFMSPRANALYYYKMARRYEDVEAQRRYLEEYMSLGGTGKGLRQSLEAMHPLYGLDGAEQAAFVEWLGPAGRERLGRAVGYYAEILE